MNIVDITGFGLLLLPLLLVTGFVGCAEFASVTLVHPVVRTLPPESQVTMEKGLLRTFGIVMPVGMTAAPILAGSVALQVPSPWFVAAAVALTVALVVTTVGNVPINLWTARLPADGVDERFRSRRRRWDVFQAVRGSLQLAGFVLTCLGTSALVQPA